MQTEINYPKTKFNRKCVSSCGPEMDGHDSIGNETSRSYDVYLQFVR
jgi:hypothetical protein